MQDLGLLFGDLTNEQCRQILEAGEERELAAETVLVVEGQQLTHVHLLIEGLVHVRTRSTGDKPLIALGPGEIIGAISFMEQARTSSSVVTVEPSRVVTLSHESLNSPLEKDRDLAAGFYRVLALIGARRVRRIVDSVSDSSRTPDPAKLEGEAGEIYAATRKGLDEFKETAIALDKALIKNDTAQVESLAAKVEEQFHVFTRYLNNLYTKTDKLEPRAKKEIGHLVQREFMPYLLMTQSGERMYSKPRGYPGDFFTLEMMYQNKPEGSGRMGALLDRCFLNATASVAVRNRRELLKKEILKSIGQSDTPPTRILSLVCGPAREVQDVYRDLEDPGALKATLLDLDMQALAFVSEWVEKARLNKQIDLLHANLIYLALGRKTLEVPPQDLVYSIGLVDYFEDPLVVKLLNYIHSVLKPGGRVILGNFHPENNSRTMMEYLLEWKLIHRDEKGMNALFEHSAFGKSCSQILFEEEKVNLFATCVKD